MDEKDVKNEHYNNYWDEPNRKRKNIVLFCFDNFNKFF